MMKKTLSIAGIMLAVLLLAASTVYAFANAPEGGSMGVWGYVANSRQASLDVAERQTGTGELIVQRVAAPQDAWVVVHLDDQGMPGERVGLQHISGGVSEDVRVKLDGTSGKDVIVAVHADKGTPSTFDFDMENKTTSPDRPFFVNGKELAAEVTIE
jgi:hypothetical protein